MNPPTYEEFREWGESLVKVSSKLGETIIYFAAGWRAEHAELAALRAENATFRAELAAANRECEVRNERELGYLARAQSAEAELAALREDAERWKERAEYEYGKQVYPHEMGLAWGALDVSMKTWRWENKQALIDAAIDAARKETK